MKIRNLFCIALLCVLTGCSGIQVNSEYDKLIDDTAAWSNEVATRAESNGFTETEKTRALRISSNHWQSIKAAKDGRNATTLPAN